MLIMRLQNRTATIPSWGNSKLPLGDTIVSENTEITVTILDYHPHSIGKVEWAYQDLCTNW